MEKVSPWCGQPSDRGRLKIRSDFAICFFPQFRLLFSCPVCPLKFSPFSLVQIYRTNVQLNVSVYSALGKGGAVGPIAMSMSVCLCVR